MSLHESRRTKTLTCLITFLSIPMILLLCFSSGGLLLVCDEMLNPADVIIVLGHRMQPDGQPSEIMQARVQRGVDLYLEGYASTILFTGGATQGNFVEAEIMTDLAVESGVPPDVIVEETQSRNTMENARFSANIMRTYGWQSAIIVTSPYHTQRAVKLFQNQGVQVVGCAPTPETRNWLSQIGAILYEFINWIWYFCTDIRETCIDTNRTNSPRRYPLHLIHSRDA